VPSKAKSQIKPKNTSIFDDSESDDDLFSSASSTTSSKVVKRDSRQGSSKEKPKVIISAGTSLNKSKSIGLFGDSDAEEALFASSSTKQNKPKAEKGKTGSSESAIRIMESEKSLDIQSRSEVSPVTVDQDATDLLKEDKEKSISSNDIDGRNNEDKEILQTTTPTDYYCKEEKQIITEKEDIIDPGVQETGANTVTVTPKEDHSQPSTISKVKNSKLKLKFEPKKETPEEQAKMKAAAEKVRPQKYKSASELISAIKSRLPPPDKEGDDNEETKKESPNNKPVKRSVSVKALALGLNLNPLAMKPGAKPPKLGSVDKTDSEDSEPPAGTPNKSDFESCPGTPDSPSKSISTIDVDAEATEEQPPDPLVKRRSSSIESSKSNEDSPRTPVDEPDSPGPLLASLVKVCYLQTSYLSGKQC
jgi:hypothetical protein